MKQLCLIFMMVGCEKYMKRGISVAAAAMVVVVAAVVVVTHVL